MGEDTDSSSESGGDSGSGGRNKKTERSDLAAGKNKVNVQRNNAKSKRQDSDSKNPKVEKGAGKEPQDSNGPPSAEGQNFATSVTSNSDDSANSSSGDGDSGSSGDS